MGILFESIISHSPKQIGNPILLRTEALSMPKHKNISIFIYVYALYVYGTSVMIDVVAFQHIPFQIILNEEISDISSTINMFDFNYNRLMADVNATVSFDYIFNNKCNTLISTFMSCHVMSVQNEHSPVLPYITKQQLM